MTITLRQESQAGATTKSASLNYQELDNNFIDLLTTKILPIQIDADTGSVKVGEAQSNGVFTITGASGITTTVTEDSAGNANLTITGSAGNEGVSEIIGGSNIEATQPDSGGSVTLEVTNPAVLNLDGAVVFTAKNTSGATIEKGQVVYISGHDGTNPTIAIADADDAAKMPAFGLANEQITNTNTGEIITYGPIINIDTSHFTAGEELFVNTESDSADDTITSSAPTGENGLIQKIGKVIRSHSSTGVIFVTGAGRTNATPNLTNGNVFIGNAQNQVSTTSLATYITDRSINEVSEDSSPELGGNLSVNGNSIVSVSGGDINITPDGSGKVVIDGLNYPQADGQAGDFLVTDGSNNLGFARLQGGTDITVTQPDSAGAFTISYTGSGGGISNVVEDTTPQLGGDLQSNGNEIHMDETTGIIKFNNTDLQISAGTNTNTILSSQSLLFQQNSSSTFTVADHSGNALFKINPASATELYHTTNKKFETTSGGVSFNGNYQEKIHAATYNANFTPEPSDGSIQTITLTGNINFQGFATETEGASITLVITQDTTGNRTFTEDLDSGGRMLFAGGTSTLSTAADAIDIMTITFIGGTYFASLSTNFS